jgi:hypothetical protein
MLDIPYTNAKVIMSEFKYENKLLSRARPVMWRGEDMPRQQTFDFDLARRQTLNKLRDRIEAGLVPKREVRKLTMTSFAVFLHVSRLEHLANRFETAFVPERREANCKAQITLPVPTLFHQKASPTRRHLSLEAEEAAREERTIFHAVLFGRDQVTNGLLGRKLF